MVKTIDEFIANTRITVHGGFDYKDEVAETFRGGHPILSIEMGDQIRHFKCTSINLNAVHKTSRIKDKYYMIKDPEDCQLTDTIKMVKQPYLQAVVDFNHSVYLLNDDTPPLHVYPDGDIRNRQDQKRFEVSDRDKRGILEHIVRQVMMNNAPIPKPEVSRQDCLDADRKWQKQHPSYRPHYVQVAKKPELELKIDDLDLANIRFNKLMQ